MIGWVSVMEGPRATRRAVPDRRPVPRRPGPVPHRWVGDVAVAAAGLGLGAVIAMAVTAETAGSLHSPGGWTIFAGRMAALVGSYLLLLSVLLVGRIPAVEAAVGQERLVRWHRWLGPWPLVLLSVHAVTITVGYAQLARTGAWHQFGVFLSQYPDVLASTVALGLLLAAGVTSVRAARRRMRYETWWAVHLYTYLAMALAFSHQLANGMSFIVHPLVRVLWGVLWASTAGVVLLYRVGLPIGRTLRHRLKVVEVREEAPGVVSIVCAGRAVDRLAVSGGQFFQWRFLTRGLWWHAHPYSLSALPHPPHLRVTVKEAGDQSSALRSLRPGTRVVIEGPYGSFTPHLRQGPKVLLVAAGVGVTPIRALLEDLPAGVKPTVVLRASSRQDLVLRDEVAELVARRGGTLHELVGPRSKVKLDARALKRLVPDIRSRDLYICGPEGFTKRLVTAARALSVPEDRIHHEAFAF